MDRPGLEDCIKGRFLWRVVLDPARPHGGLRRDMGIRFNEVADRGTS